MPEVCCVVVALLPAKAPNGSFGGRWTFGIILSLLLSFPSSAQQYDWTRLRPTDCYEPGTYEFVRLQGCYKGRAGEDVCVGVFLKETGEHVRMLMRPEEAAAVKRGDWFVVEIL